MARPWRTSLDQSPTQIGPAKGRSSAWSGTIDHGDVMIARRKTRGVKKSRRSTMRHADRPQKVAPAPEVTIDPTEARIAEILRKQAAHLEVRESLRAIR